MLRPPSPLTRILRLLRSRTGAVVTAAAAAAVGLAACGGGASFGGGIGGSGIVFGVIEGLGSIIVDGIEFDAATAEVFINGEAADESALMRGLVVRIEGEIDADAGTGVARRIESATIVEGPVTAIDLASDSAIILGNTVVIDADTIFASVVLAPDAVGRIVEVSGLVDADGIVRATRFAARAVDGSTELSVGGVIERLDEGVETFVIRGVTIDFSGAEIVDAPPGGLSDGLAVYVVVADAPLAGTARATLVRVRPDVVAENEDRVVRIRGIVTNLAPPDVFVVNKVVRVLIRRRTEILGGTAADIQRNAAVRVVGSPRADRTIVAERIFLLTADVAPSPLAARDQP